MRGRMRNSGSENRQGGSGDPGRLARFAAYLDLFERFTDAILLLDPETLVILDANTASERMLETAGAELLGKAALKWVDAESQGDFEKYSRIAKRSYYPRVFTSHWITPGGRKLIMQVMIGMLDLSNEKKVLQVIARDVTHAHELEQKAKAYLEELEAAKAKLELLATTDAMTGLANFRRFKQALEDEVLRAQRYDVPLSLIFCDVDHFKNYNDKNGHPAGDALLKQFAQVLRNCCRDTDFPARYGGEEFVVLCPGTNPTGAQALAERIRAAVEKFPFEYREKQPLGKVSVSIGVATFPLNAKSAADLTEAADQAVYASKKGGRNRVTFSSAVPAPTTKKNAA